ncbi:endonuclease/exonuclease/phosphatase family protein [Allorhizobium sp. BGMRC 0089]|uniref:endonuclease/exonuclease/phosphatase family protein n=1 Tax=Allorhizobium sonneratiae TaxID=2934936 RepID=UPI00203489A4|nr:endonuclease/exonuclease/phosphatase family protein [Allorhizobium sonneratiae]MCM2294053.1 endonuclease/exonuclease/phosphatase family protein [Allorhizobium sonneratiae]
MTSRILTVMTYNVHSCIGSDRRLDPGRIADVVAACKPDILALQELDVGRRRSAGIDQAEVLAARLGMRADFHPALTMAGEDYGDAILTALPMKRRKAAALPAFGEPRGALWVEILVKDRPLQVFNTHFGLNARERRIQADTLMGEGWIGHPSCRDKPVLLMGDFNAIPGSAAYRRIAGGLSDLRKIERKRTRPTFPSRLPLLRLDHIFYGQGVKPLSLATLRCPLARLASDHLPLLGRIGLDDA